jgi:dihydroflavonol-4-reductase
MVLVTGGTGFIGSHLVEALLESGQTPRCLIRSTKKQIPAKADIVYGDLESGAGLAEALEGVETVIHLAGVTKALSKGEFYLGNARATENLARAVAGRAIRMVHVSSLAAIGPSEAGAPVAEDAEPRPLTHYGKSKLLAEQSVRELLPDAVIVRPPVVYGPRDTDVFQMLKSISHGVQVRIAGGERWFQAIYVKDLVDGILTAARSPQAAGRTYFLAHDKVVCWSELGTVAGGIMGNRPRVLRIPVPIAYAVGCCAELWSGISRKPGILSREKVREAQCRYWTCDTRRAAHELGFEARTSLALGISETLAWYRQMGWLRY